MSYNCAVVYVASRLPILQGMILQMPDILGKPSLCL